MSFWPDAMRLQGTEARCSDVPPLGTHLAAKQRYGNEIFRDLNTKLQSLSATEYHSAGNPPDFLPQIFLFGN